MSAGEHVLLTQAALHNMSAPPRSFVDLRPMGKPMRDSRPTARDAGQGGPCKAEMSAVSARLFARVDLVGLLCDGQSHLPRGRDIAKLIDGLPHDLVKSVALLRQGEANGGSIRVLGETCTRLPLHELHDEFLDRVSGLGAVGLPPLLLARRLDPQLAAPDDSPVPPLKALRLLACTAGGLFLRDRRPGAALFMTGLTGDRDVGQASFDYYLPAHPRKGDSE